MNPHLMSPQTMQQRYAAYREMRETEPVFYLPGANLWMLYRYEDVHRALVDHTVFSSDFEAFNGPQSDPEAALALQSMIGKDEPMHKQLRDLVMRAFTPRMIESWAPRVSEIIRTLLRKAVETGNFDAIHDLGDPLPVTVIGEMLGIPEAYRAQFKADSDTLLQGSFATGARSEAATLANRRLLDHFREIIVERRSAPRSDLVSALLAAEIDGECLTERDLLALFSLLLIAGNGTTMHLIGNMLLAFMENPVQLDRVRADRSLIPSAIEEALRYYSPSLAVLRTTKTDVALSGRTLPAGARVMPQLCSANRDERKFTDPERFEIARKDTPHIAFGYGIHFCLGAPLARLEGRLVLAALLDHFEKIELADAASLTLNPGMLINSLNALPLKVTPTSARV
jgi:cytochrome P450